MFLTAMMSSSNFAPPGCSVSVEFANPFQVLGSIFRLLPITTSTSGMRAKPSESICAAQPVTSTFAPGFSRRCLLIAWRDFRTASAVTAQVLTTHEFEIPAAAAISRMASVS